MKRRGESFHFYAVARIGSDVSLSIRLHNVVTFRDGGQPSAEIGEGGGGRRRKKGGRRNERDKESRALERELEADYHISVVDLAFV